MQDYPIMNSFGMNTKLFYIPSDKHDHSILGATDAKTKADLADKYGILIDYDWECCTISYVMLKTIISHLAYLMKSTGHDNIGIDFYSLLKTYISVKKNEKAEKEGNINIYFEPGPKAIELIENPITTDTTSSINEFIPENDPEELEFLKKLDSQCNYELITHYGLAFTENCKMFTCAITVVYLRNLIMELCHRVATNPDKDTVDSIIESVNFNDLVEIHCEYKNGGAMLYIRPGANAKLLIKCDELTEQTMGDFAH